MRRKLSLLLIILSMAGLFFLVKTKLLPKPTTGDNYAPGKVWVNFTDEAPYSEVLQFIENQGLNYYIPDPSFKPMVVASSCLLYKNRNDVIENLRRNNFVSNAERTEPPAICKSDILINFILGTTKSEANDILKQEGLVMENFIRSANIMFYVPPGEEKDYANKFKILTIVESTNLDYYYEPL